MFSKKSSEKLLAKGPSLVCYLCQSERTRQTIIAASLQTSAAGSAGNSEWPEVNFLLIRAQSILACPSLGHLQAVWLGCGRAEGAAGSPRPAAVEKAHRCCSAKLLQPGHGKSGHQWFPGLDGGYPSASLAVVVQQGSWNQSLQQQTPSILARLFFLSNTCEGRECQGRQAGK